MLNESDKKDSYNYGTVYGTVLNVNNAANAYIYGMWGGVNVTNGYSNSIATSKDEKIKVMFIIKLTEERLHQDI